MGKGGANPYPFWWATSENSRRETGGGNTIPEYYKSKQDRDREYYNEYYREKGYSQRREEFKTEFKRRFMNGEFFESETNTNFAGCETGQRQSTTNDIHPIFKIKKSSSHEDFKKEYKKLILKHHPDKSGEDGSMFIKIQEAWENLRFNV